jgi:cold shock protein
MLAPYSSGLLMAQWDWGPRRCCLADTIVSDFAQNLRCGAVRNGHRADARFVFRWHGLTRRQTMQKGTVKWFNPTKGYGFIKPADGEKDVFVHISAVERAGLRTLNEGQTVEYELVTNRGRTSAENLKVA